MTEESEPVIDGVPSSNRHKKNLAHKLLGNNRFQLLVVVILCGLIGGSYLLVKAASTSYSLWSNSTIPRTITSSTSSGIELGVKFKSSNSGYVTGIRFYKGVQNTGTHTGSLWTAGGSLLASVTFTKETASGWQTATFAQPVNIAANVVYVVSYFAPNGHYSYNTNYFSRRSYTNGPLTALASKSRSTSANGVYFNSSTPAFPIKSMNSTNFWVDLVFSTQLVSAPVAPAPPTTVTAVQSGSSIVVSWNAGISSNPIASYNVLRNGTLLTSVSSTTLTRTDSNLTAGQTYGYQIETVSNTNAVSAASVTATATYNVASTVPAPTVTLSVSPASITAGNSSKLTWSSTNATSCTAASPSGWTSSTATSGSQSVSPTSTTSYTMTCTGSAGHTTSSAATVTVSAATVSSGSSGSSSSGSSSSSSGSSCSTNIPTVSSNSLYPLQQVVNFTGSTLPSVWDDYGNEVQQPAGYVAASHAVFVPGTGLEIKGYPDSISGNVGGVTGGSGDIWGSGSTDATNEGVANSGGFDVCFSMSSGNWQDVHLVIISWPSDNNWNEGENDFFEGNPQDLAINVHEIGSNPATNVWQGSWPSSLATGTHDISARWDPVNGYRFYLDGSLVGTASISSSVTTPTTSHHLSIQMQDTSEASTSTETATIYWTASYGYN
jgi:hypothetical protein